MFSLERDPIINTINNGIKKDIEVTFKSNCLRAAVILIYAGMDAMALLNMPPEKEEVQREDFIQWVDHYIKFPCEEQLTSVDLYGARCSMLHAYGIVSRLSRVGKCRMIGYMDKSIPEICYNPKVSTELVLVSITALKTAFIKGIDRFLIDVFSDKEKSKIVEERLKTFVHELPVQDQEEKEKLNGL